MSFRIKKSELYKIIAEEITLMNGNGSRWGLPGNWAAKVVPQFEIDLDEDIEEEEEEESTEDDEAGLKKESYKRLEQIIRETIEEL